MRRFVRCLNHIVEMRCCMLNAVTLLHCHVVHLYWEPYVEGWMPYLLIDIWRNRERICFLRSILQVVDARLGDGGEIRLGIVVACVVAPFLEWCGQYALGGAIGLDLIHIEGGWMVRSYGSSSMIASLCWEGK